MYRLFSRVMRVSISRASVSAVSSVLTISLGVAGAAPSTPADLAYEVSLATSGQLVVIADAGGDLVRESSHDEAEPLSAERTYAVVTRIGDAIAIEGDSLEGAVSGDSFSGVLTIPGGVAADLGIPTGSMIDADSAQGADVIDLISQIPPLAVEEATVQSAAVYGASVSAPHYFDVAIVTPPNSADPLTSNSAMDGFLTEVGSYWMRETNNAVSSFTRPATVARYQSMIACTGDADNSLWREAAGKFGRGTSSYHSGAGRHLIVILPEACLASMGVGLGSVGSLQSGGLVRVVEYRDTLRPTLAHEIGHNLGLGHSNLSYCHGDPSESASCTEYSYADQYSVMGAAWVGYPAIPALPAPMRDELGGYASGAELNLTGSGEQGSGTHTLKPATDSSGLRSIRIDDPLSDFEYFLEYRTGRGADTGAVYTRNNRMCQDPTCTEGWGSGSGLRVLVRDTSDGSSRSIVYTHYLDATSPKWSSPVLSDGASFSSPSGGVVVRRGAGDAAGVAVTVQFGGWPGPSAQPSSSRIGGADRYAVAVGVSQVGNPDGATVPVVYLTSGANYPDALSAAPGAAKQGAPLLLTSPTSLPVVVADEIKRLDPATVVVVGGPASVGTQVLDQIRALPGSPSVVRLGGVDRYAASRAVVSHAFGGPAAPSVPVAYIATGANFPDALAASAAGGAFGYPVILVSGGASTIDEPTRALLLDLGVQTIKIAGGEQSVSAGIERSLASLATTIRLSGADRYAAADAINRDAFAGQGRGGDVFLATGLNFPDALAGAALAGSRGAPLFLSRTGCVPYPTLIGMSELAPERVVLLGGRATLTDSVESLARCY